MSKSITFRVSDDQAELLRDWAESDGRSISNTILRRLFVSQMKMEHLATDPAHRPVPQTLEVRNAATPEMMAEANRRNTNVATPSWMERNSSQTARDDILRGINKKK